MFPSQRLFSPIQILFAMTALLLAACSGGTPETAPSGTTPIGPFTISGTAATGAPVPQGTVVTVKCATGTDTVTLNDATGAFTLIITDGAAPCVLRSVTPSTPGPSQTMYGVAMAAGTANITPLTHAVADAAAASVGSSIASAFENWGVSFTPSTLSASSVSTAKTALLAYLTNAGFTVTGVGDFLTEPFTANGQHAHDKLLDEVVATKLPLSQLTAQAKTLVGGGLPDTGQTLCSDVLGSPEDCALTGQDGKFGLDASPATNSDLDGKAGFSYLKLDSAGKPLAASALSWDCVLDNITGLVWENKVADTDTTHLRSSAHTYAWYSTDSRNGGEAGDKGNNSCNNTLPNFQCHTQAYVTAVNAAKLCGKSDWRLPTMDELISIVDYGTVAPNVAPTIDVTYFANTVSALYWSSFSQVETLTAALGVSFRTGDPSTNGDSNSYKVRSNPVRLVRSSQ